MAGKARAGWLCLKAYFMGRLFGQHRLGLSSFWADYFAGGFLMMLRLR
jgi:hypothetical protein